MPLAARTALLIIMTAFLLAGFPRVDTATQAPRLSPVIPTIPIQTDDGQDPITLIFTGFAPSWWVASNLAGWGDSAYCSGPKTVGGGAYSYTLERPDPFGLPCYGPRDHIRIWDMGYNPVFGEWSIASAHHEHTVCDPICHHVIDSWEGAEADARSSFLNGPHTLSISNYSLSNSGFYQGIFNDGNATLIQFKPPSGSYPVVFTENGLTNQTSWSVTIDGTSVTSPRPAIVFAEPNGSFLFSIGTPSGFNSYPSSGKIVIGGSGEIQSVLFRTPWTTSDVIINSIRGPMLIDFNGNATIAASSLQVLTAGDIVIRFSTTEIGRVGALNISVPRSVITLRSSVLVRIDAASDDNAVTSSDSVAYHTFFVVSFGTHMVELRYPAAGIEYVAYLTAGVVTTVILGVLLLSLRFKTRRKPESATTPVNC